MRAGISRRVAGKVWKRFEERLRLTRWRREKSSGREDS